MYKLRQDNILTIDIGGATLTCRAPTTASIEACKAAADRRFTGMLANPADAIKAGFDPDDKAVREHWKHDLTIREIGKAHIESWEGIAAEHGTITAPVTPENIELFLRVPSVASIFFGTIISGQLLLDSAKKDSGVAAPGTSGPAAAPNIAAAAPK